MRFIRLLFAVLAFGASCVTGGPPLDFTQSFEGAATFSGLLKGSAKGLLVITVGQGYVIADLTLQEGDVKNGDQPIEVGTTVSFEGDVEEKGDCHISTMKEVEHGLDATLVMCRGMEIVSMAVSGFGITGIATATVVAPVDSYFTEEP